MTTRNLPKIEAFSTGLPIDWDQPVETAEMFTPVKAAHEDARSINVFGRIGEDPFDERGGVTDRLVSAALRRMGSGPVTVNINSRGGDFFTGVNVYNQLREHEGDVTVRVLGLAASAASIIAMASDTLQIAKAGFLMIHNSHGIVMGDASEMESAASLFRQFDGAMAGVYTDRSGQDREQIAKWMEAETFFNGEEAVEAGLADSLLASDEVESDDEPAQAAALRRIDTELAQKGIPRSERRALLAEVAGGTPRATSHVTPCADEQTVAEAIRNLGKSISA